MENKGQTALEYLITYGWAILVILVVLAVLWYYGIFNPSTWAGAQVVHGSAFQVVDYKITTNQLQLVLGNKVGNNIQVNSLTLGGTGSDATGTCDAVSCPKNLTAGVQGSFNVTISPVLLAGSTVSVIITANYDDLKTGVTGKTDTMKLTNVKVG
jgi:hypothetical protein